ncbi:MAG: hypothetical protein HGA45_39680 [Chloroflexales bacterium]|nr:hypothetical protein [Chloroflexales bacterium]
MARPKKNQAAAPATDPEPARELAEAGTKQRRKKQKAPELPPGAPTHKACPDCYDEGRDPYILPVATHFYIKRVSDPRYKSGVRISTYCREHTAKRRNEQYANTIGKLVQIERETGVTAPELQAYRDDRKGRPRRRRPYTRAELAAQRKQNRARYERDRDVILARNAEWAKANPEKRAASQQAWYEANKERLKRERRTRAVLLLGRGRTRSRLGAATPPVETPTTEE